MTSQNGFIPEEEYKRIETSVVFSCVDVVISYDHKFLLGKRRNEPGAGWWWTAGGRVLMGELLIDAVKRKVKDDFGIDGDYSEPRFLFTGETIFKNPEGGYRRHTVNVVYLVELEKDPNIDFEKSGISDFSEIGWFEKIDPTWHEYLKLCLEKAGFK